MQEMSRNVASSGTGESVTTIGAVAFTCRTRSIISRMFRAFSSTVVSRNTWRSASKISFGTPRQNTPPVSRSCQTSARPIVKTNAPASANASDEGLALLVGDPLLDLARLEPVVAEAAAGLGAGHAPGDEIEQRIRVVQPLRDAQLRRQQPCLAQERPQLAGEAGAEGDDEVVGLEERLRRRVSREDVVADQPVEVVELSPVGREELGVGLVPGVRPELLRTDRVSRDQEADVPRPVRVGELALQRACRVPTVACRP